MNSDVMDKSDNGSNVGSIRWRIGYLNLEVLSGKKYYRRFFEEKEKHC